MLSEFCLITGAEENRMQGRRRRCEERVLQYAPLEQKRVVKQLLDEMKLNDGDNDGNM